MANPFDSINHRLSKSNPLGSFDINRFRSTLTSTTNTSSFLMMFMPPKIFTPDLTGGLNAEAAAALAGVVATSKDLSFLCHGASLPSKQITSVDYLTSGPRRKMPNGYITDDLQLQFYSRAGMLERFVFETWLNIITGNFRFQWANSGKRYDIEYYDNIHSEIFLQKYSPMGKLEYIYKFDECYPLAIQDVPVSWENQNEIMKFNVTFAYRDWEGYAIPDVDSLKDTVKNTVRDTFNSVKTLVTG